MILAERIRVIVDDQSGRVIRAIAMTADGREVYYKSNEHRELVFTPAHAELVSWGKWTKHEVDIPDEEMIIVEINPRGIPGLLYWATLQEYLHAVRNVLSYRRIP